LKLKMTHTGEPNVGQRIHGGVQGRGEHKQTREGKEEMKILEIRSHDAVTGVRVSQ